MFIRFFANKLFRSKSQCFVKAPYRMNIFIIITFFIFSSCTKDKDNSTIVIPPGELLKFSISEFSKFSDNNFEAKIRSIEDNKKYKDLTNVTPKKEILAEKISEFSYITPKGLNIDGFIFFDILSKSSGINWKALVLNPNEVINPTIETTLLFDLINLYPNKNVLTYRSSDLILLQNYIYKFAQERLALFGVTNQLNPSEKYKFLANGLSNDIAFLEILKNMGLEFNYNAEGIVQSDPYPFGNKNNFPVLDEGRTTPQGEYGILESLQVNINIQFRDPDGDRLFLYWVFDKDNSILKNEKKWSWTPSFSDSSDSTYPVHAFLSDGSMIPVLANWNIKVLDNNRPPVLSGDCVLEIVENQTWICDLEAVDPDPDDDIMFSFPSAPFKTSWPLVNGLPYSAGAQINARKIHIEWTPNNRDFVKRNPFTVFQIMASDYLKGIKKNGDSVKLMNIKMKGNNSSPYPIPFSQNSSDIFNWNTPPDEIPRVLDLYGGSLFDVDTKTPNKKFYFEIVLTDDDNQRLSDDAKFDDLSLRVNLGADQIHADPDSLTNKTLEIRTINGKSIPVSVFKFWWQPTAQKPSVTASFTPMDDMEPNTQGRDFAIDLTSQPRSFVPSCLPSTVGITDLASISGIQAYSVSCESRPEPSISKLSFSSVDIAAKALAQMQTTYGNNPIYLKRNLSETVFSVKEQNFGPMLEYSAYQNSLFAGSVLFSRTGPCDSANIPTNSITIPANTLLTSTYSSPLISYVPKVSFKTVLEVKLSPYECEALVPVKAANRTAAVGKISTILPMTSDMTNQFLTVTNTTSLNYETTTNVVSVTFSRPTALMNLLIPEGTTVRTNEPTEDSIVFVVPNNIIMPVGVSSLVVKVVRNFNTPYSSPLTITPTYYDATSGILTSPLSPMNSHLVFSGVPIPGLTISNPATLMPLSTYSVEVYKNIPSAPTFSWVLNYADGTTPKLNEISQIRAPFLEPGTESAPAMAFRSVPGFSDLRLRNPLWTDPSMGTLEFYRLLNGPDLTIPVGLVVATIDRKLYQTISSGTLGSTNSILISAIRIYENSYKPISHSAGFKIRYNNKTPSIKAFPSNIRIPAGVETSIAIEMTDNLSEVLNPVDPFDRYYVNEYKISSGPNLLPSSKVCICREATGLNCATCTPCNRTPASPPPATDPMTVLNLASLSHQASRYCYFRVTPDSNDVAITYTYSVKICDTSATQYGCQTSFLPFYVLEENKRPYFTASHNYGSLTPGNVIGSTTDQEIQSPTSTTLSVPNPFVEGQTGVFTIYAYDPNKDINNRTLGFSILPNVYHLKSSAPADLGYKPKPPGLNINPLSLQNLAGPGGVGSLSKIDVVWLPTDADSKNFSSSEGFIFGVRVTDSTSPALSQTIYYKAVLNNTNSTPQIGPIGAAVNLNSYTVNVDTYFNQTFSVTDNDFATPIVGSPFQTLISACWKLDGTRNANTFFDSTYTGDDICHLAGPEWGSDSYEPSYTGNITVPQCRTGAGGINLNTDLAAPKITRYAGPSINSTAKTISYSFKIEWCPQKKHIGNYSIGISVYDNGDRDLKGTLLVRKGGMSPLNLKVVAPVFLSSPQMDSSNLSTIKTIRQTSADLTNYPFQYQVIAKNPKGNPLTYSIVSSPRACELPNGVCINPVTGLVSWIPSRLDITDGFLENNKKITVKVKDNVTNEIAQGTISLWIQDPTIYPYEQGPSITSTMPATVPPIPITINEFATLDFTVEASDPNTGTNIHDKLFARMYIDGKAVDDAEMIFGNPYYQTTFRYTPSAIDGTSDSDNQGPLPQGRHLVRIEVTDGNFIDSKTWTVNVRNTMINSELLFDVKQQRKAVEPTVNFLNWNITTEVAGKSNPGAPGDYLYEALYFSGSYLRNGITKNYLWALEIVNGLLTKTGAGGKWKYYENIPWGSGTKTERISFKLNPVSNVNNIFITNQINKYGPFTNSSNSIKMYGDLSTYLNPLQSTAACSGCQNDLYLNEGYGSILSAKFNSNRNFYAIPPNFNTLYWDKNATGPALVVPGLPGGYTITGLAVNPNTKRLFVSGTKNTDTENKVIVYDIAPTILPVPAAPIKLSEIDVSATGAWPIQGPSIPSDIAIDVSNPRGHIAKVLVYLKGIGGYVVFQDNPPAVPTTASISTIGIGDIGSSSSDTIGGGIKLVYDLKNDLFIGIIKEGKTIITIDPVTFTIVKKPTDTNIDSIQLLSTGTQFLIDRSGLMIYRGK